MNQFIAIILIVFTSIGFTQNQPILPAQKNAIQALASENGYSNEGLNSFLIEKYGVGLSGLTKSQATEMIQTFQSGNLPQSVSTEPVLADILEIGMAKKFHLRDGNVIRGTITDIVQGKCKIETAEGILTIPMTAAAPGCRRTMRLSSMTPPPLAAGAMLSQEWPYPARMIASSRTSVRSTTRILGLG